MIDSLYELMAKIGFTDPLHAPLTHIPIGLVIGAFLFFLVAVLFGRKNLVVTARHVSILAFIFVFPTILFGVFDWLHFFKGALIAPIKFKMILASVVIVLLAAGIIVGSELKVRTAPMMVIYALAVVGVVGLGWFGGKLVYGGFSPAQEAAAPAAPGRFRIRCTCGAGGAADVRIELFLLPSKWGKRHRRGVAAEEVKDDCQRSRACRFHPVSEDAGRFGGADASVPAGPAFRQAGRGTVRLHPVDPHLLEIDPGRPCGSGNFAIFFAQGRLAIFFAKQWSKPSCTVILCLSGGRRV